MIVTVLACWIVGSAGVALGMFLSGLLRSNDDPQELHARGIEIGYEAGLNARCNEIEAYRRSQAARDDMAVAG